MRTINRKINLIVIHCSATRVDKDYTPEQLERDHKARGFNSAGYNYYNNYKLETICKMIGRWAPENENDTDSYIKAVSDYAGIPADDPININDREQMIRIVAGMSKVENGREAEMSDVIAGWNLL